MAKLVLVTGGRRAGKSRFAEDYVLRLSDFPLYLASGVAIDEEFAERIEHHKRVRGKRFQTIKEPLYR